MFGGPVLGGPVLGGPVLGGPVFSRTGRLTTIGASRPETRLPTWESGDGTPHGGFSTQSQLRTLVAYAALRDWPS